MKASCYHFWGLNTLNKVIKYPISHNLQCVATLFCEIVVFKNRNDPELCEENCHARLSHSKRLLKNIYPVTLASFLFIDEKIFTMAALKNLQNDWQNASAATKKKRDAIKLLLTRLTVSLWGHQSASHKWLTVHQCNTCRSWSQD